MIIEPNRLPLLTLHDLATKRLQGVASAFETKALLKEVQHFIVPVQERLRRIVYTLDNDEAVLSTFRLKRMLEDFQNSMGDRLWRWMDKSEPAWIENQYHIAFAS